MGETGLKEREEHHADTTETKVVRRRGRGDERNSGREANKKAAEHARVVRWCGGGVRVEDCWRSESERRVTRETWRLGFSRNERGYTMATSTHEQATECQRPNGW